MSKAWAPALASLLTLLAVASPGHGAILGNAEFSSTIPYDQDLGRGNSLTLVSGTLDADIAPTPAGYGFLHSSGATIDGVAKACWSVGLGGCTEGDLTVRVAAGGSFGYRTPLASAANASADHAIVLFVDLASMPAFGFLPVTRSAVASTINGSFEPGSWRDVPVTTFPNLDTSVGVIPFDDTTRIDILRAGQVVHSVKGGSEAVLLQGRMAMAPFDANAMVLPFTFGSELHMGRAAAGDAELGTNLTYLASQLSGLTKDPLAGFDLGPLQPLVGGMLDGALIQAPLSNDTKASDVEFVRFTDATVAGGTSVLVRGEGPLVVQDNHVAGAPSLYGFWIFQLPLWSYLLWLVAVTLYITAVVRKAPRTNERWERYNWIGIVASFVVGALVFWLWDLEFRNLFGASLLQGGLGASFWYVAAAEVGMAMLVHFVVVSPLRMAIAQGLRLGEQGHFMRLARPTALLLGLLLGVGLMRAYLDYGLQYAFG